MEDWIAIGITAVFVLVMGVVYFGVTSQRRRSNLIPTVITTIGILGTFVGITYGLLRFDVTNIQTSIPKLLEGLKIAFLTSIAGLVIAVFIRLYNFYMAGKEQTSTEGATIDTLAELLEQQNKTIENQNEPLIKSLKSIEHSLVGEGDSTLITQLQKTRTTLGDKLDLHKELIENKSSEIIKELREFAKKVAEDNSQALISALEGVIRDFNAKINEQFGENFKHLNESVGRLLEWQEQYRIHMNELVDRFRKAGESFNNIDKNLREITGQLNTVLELVDELDSFMKLADNHLKSMNDSIEAHAEMAEKAKSVFPEIESRIKALTEGFGRSVEEAIESNQSAVNKLQDALKEQSTFLTEYSDQMGQTAQKVVSELDTQIVELIKKNNNHINNQFSQFSQNMDRELNKSISSLGSQLLSLSNKFVKDYTPLTDRLRRLMEIAGDGTKSN